MHREQRTVVILEAVALKRMLTRLPSCTSKCSRKRFIFSGSKKFTKA